MSAKTAVFCLLLLAQCGWAAASCPTEHRAGLGPHNDHSVRLTLDADGTEQEEEESFEDESLQNSSESAYIKTCHCGPRRHRHDDRITFLDGMARETLASRPPPLS